MKNLLAAAILSILLIHAAYAAPLSEGLGKKSSISALIVNGDARVVMVGDSITNKNTNTENQSSMYWGAVRTWEPQSWKGIVTPTNGHMPTMQYFQAPSQYAITTNKNLQNVTTSLFSYGYRRIASSSAGDTVWMMGRDQPANSAIVGSQLHPNGEWRDDDWFENTKLEASIIYLQSPYTIDQVKATTTRFTANESERTIIYTNLKSQTAHVASLKAPTAPATAGSVRFMVRAEGNYNESENQDHFIWLGTRIYRPQGTGLQLDAMAVGGAKLRDFLVNGRFATDDMLRAYLNETGSPNVFYIQLGANDGTFTPTWKADMVTLIERYNRLSKENGVTPYFILVAPYGTQNSISYLNAREAATILHSIALEGTSRSIGNEHRVPGSQIAFINLPELMKGPISQELLRDNIHPTPAGADFVASLAWSQIATTTIPQPCPLQNC